MIDAYITVCFNEVRLHCLEEKSIYWCALFFLCVSNVIGLHLTVGTFSHM